MEDESWSRLSGNHSKSIREASEKHLGDIWEAFGETYLAGVPKRARIMTDRSLNTKIHVSRKRSCKLLAWPGGF